jgi:hypothetical protein
VAAGVAPASKAADLLRNSRDNPTGRKGMFAGPMPSSGFLTRGGVNALE